MTWGYTPRGGLPREEIEHADFANSLDRAMSLPGNYLAGLHNGQMVRFSAAHFLDGGAIHLDDVSFEGVSVSLPGGVDIQIEGIAWIAETGTTKDDPPAGATPVVEPARRGVTHT